MRLLDLILIKDLRYGVILVFYFKIIYSKTYFNETIFLVLLLSATTFAVAQEDLSVTLIDFIHKTNSESGGFINQ
jgi:hypothetical protein